MRLRRGLGIRALVLTDRAGFSFAIRGENQPAAGLPLGLPFPWLGHLLVGKAEVRWGGLRSRCARSSPRHGAVWGRPRGEWLAQAAGALRRGPGHARPRRSGGGRARVAERREDGRLCASRIAGEVLWHLACWEIRGSALRASLGRRFGTGLPGGWAALCCAHCWGGGRHWALLGGRADSAPRALPAMPRLSLGCGPATIAAPCAPWWCISGSSCCVRTRSGLSSPPCCS